MLTYIICLEHSSLYKFLTFMAKNTLNIPHVEFSRKNLSIVYLTYHEIIIPKNYAYFVKLSTRKEKLLYANLQICYFVNFWFLVFFAGLFANYLLVFILVNYFLNSLLPVNFLTYLVLHSFALSLLCYDQVWSVLLKSQLGPNVLHLLGYNGPAASTFPKM